jgi:hypothetical protein
MTIYFILFPVFFALRIAVWLFTSSFYLLGFLFFLPFTILAEIGKTEQSK